MTQENNKPEPEVTRKKVTLEDIKAGRNRGNQVAFGILGVVILILVAGIIFLIMRKGGDTGPTSAARAAASQLFPAVDFQANPNAHVGNRYNGVWMVNAQLGYNPTTGRLMVFKDKSSGKLLPVLFPPAVDTTFYKGQEFRVTVKVAADGLIVAESLTKD
ncbi:MAG: hypothetical protein SFY92_10000 [Verrucomicrobiae bacterium]|nr:hypothetical protein [Verrucomicrobiae bacterium]